MEVRRSGDAGIEWRYRGEKGEIGVCLAPISPQRLNLAQPGFFLQVKISSTGWAGLMQRPGGRARCRFSWRAWPSPPARSLGTHSLA